MQIKMFMFSRRDCSSVRDLPPMRRPAENWWWEPTLRRTSKICIASSRVGDMISAPRPS